VDEGFTILLAPATFGDIGTQDSHTAAINWGDGSPLETGMVDESNGSGAVTGSHVYADNGTYTVTVTVTDDDGGVGVDTFTVVVNNVAPTVQAGANQTTSEGALLNLLSAAAFNDLGAADTHTATINWGDGSAVAVGVVSETPFGPPGSAAGASGSVSGSHVYADNGTYTVTVTVTDDDGSSGSSTLIVTVNNVSPTARGNSYTTSQASPRSGNLIADNTGSGTDSDPAGANDPLTISSFTPPANGTLTLNGNGSFTYMPASTFAGDDSFTYTITDGDGGYSTATVVLHVIPAAAGSVLTIPDTSILGGTAILVMGTPLGDNIVVEPGPSSSTLKVTFNGVSTVVPKPTGRIIITGGAGDDNIQIAGAISNPVWLYGDAGNDRLNAGNGGSLLIGGDGNDELIGGGGRDVMIGGEGADHLIGNSNDDVLVAGFTIKDDRTRAGHDDFWSSVLNEWNSVNSFTVRVRNLTNGLGGNAHNGSAFLLPSVRDDVSADAIDFLNGASGDDWLIFLLSEDKVSGQAESANSAVE
jgi:PKD repeat protein